MTSQCLQQACTAHLTYIHNTQDTVLGGAEAKRPILACTQVSQHWVFPPCCSATCCNGLGYIRRIVTDFWRQTTLVSKPSTVWNFGQVGLKESQFPSHFLLKWPPHGAGERSETDDVHKASSAEPGTLRLKNARYYQYFIITIITVLLFS